MLRFGGSLKKQIDSLLAAALFVGYLSALLMTAPSLGFMRDEGFYFAAARSYEAWFALLMHSPREAISQVAVDRYWSVNHEHPSFIKGLFALSHHFFGTIFGDVSSGFRFPAMVLSSSSVALVFIWGRALIGRAGALVAALSFALIPSVFFHSHLACFDMPVSAMWLVTGYLYVKSRRSERRGWVLATGLAYGLLLDTKHNSWIFPFAILGHFLLTEGTAVWRDVRARRPFWRRLPLAWLSLLLFGPLVCFALWPWLWHDTVTRVREYVAFHTGHEFYNMEFAGRTYWKPPMPRAYSWVMTAATVPLVTLVLFALGAVAAIQRSLRDPAGRQDYVFWGVSLVASYAPWLSSNTPIFGGTKHWMTAYPFLCLLTGLGFVTVVETAKKWTPRLARPALVAACVVIGPLIMTARSHPFGLSAYTPLVGGAPGAASLGLNRTFWGYTTQSLAPFINQNAPRRGTVYVHDTALQSFAMFQEDGRLRRDLRGSLNIAASDVALYHHEPHMSRVEHQIWATYGTVAPGAIATFDGVPIAWSYARHHADQ